MKLIITLIFCGVFSTFRLFATTLHSLNIVEEETGEALHTLPLPFPYLECDDSFRQNHAWVFQGGCVVSQQSTDPRYFLMGPLCPCVGLVARGNTLSGKALFIAHLDFLTDITKLYEHFLVWDTLSIDITLHSVQFSEAEGYSSKNWGEASFTMRQAHFGRSQMDHLHFIQTTLTKSLGLKPEQITLSLHTPYEDLTDKSDHYLVDQYYAVDGVGKIWCIPPIRAELPYLIPHTCQDGKAVIERLMTLLNAKGLALRTHFGLNRMPTPDDRQKYPLLKLFEI